MDTQTRHALKNDKFALAAVHGADWLGEHKSSVLRWVIGVVAGLALVVGGIAFWTTRSSAAEAALGSAVDLYATPLAMPGAPAEPGVYNTGADRAKEANREFVAIEHDFGWLPAGTKARYFAGVTYAEMGQNGAAEKELTAASHSWDHNVANLAKLALAGVYRQTSRDNEAIEIYNQIVAKPSTTVSAAVAQLDLADLYSAEGKTDMAKALWAKVKDSDKDGAAGQIAEQKLSPKQ